MKIVKGNITKVKTILECSPFSILKYLCNHPLRPKLAKKIQYVVIEVNSNPDKFEFATRTPRDKEYLKKYKLRVGKFDLKTEFMFQVYEESTVSADAFLKFINGEPLKYFICEKIESTAIRLGAIK